MDYCIGASFVELGQEQGKQARQTDTRTNLFGCIYNQSSTSTLPCAVPSPVAVSPQMRLGSDYPDCYSSSSSSVSPPRHNRLMRKRSPSPSTRQSDIARLLDPAYASPNSHPYNGIRTIYVDHHGDLHDPDFRHFPIMHSHLNAHRQRWEPSYATHADDDDDDDEYEEEKRRSSFETQRRRPSSSTAYHSSTTAATTHAYPLYEEPSSYTSRYLAEDDEDLYEHAPLKEKERPITIRTRSPRRRRFLPDNTNEKTERSDDDPEAVGDDWTPHIVDFHVFTHLDDIIRFDE
ncbi:hypothetical protein EDD15DRAFT_2358601 [Pisolithus albus]|nr:hypothetical protein EDD15DRAFT_2358601 [Pisolithus albus]